MHKYNNAKNNKSLNLSIKFGVNRESLKLIIFLCSKVSKRELILDQYEDDEYIEHRVPGQIIDDVWVQYAEKPMKETTRSNLERIYPEEIINR